MNNFYNLSLCWSFLFRLVNTFFFQIMLSIFHRRTRKGKWNKIGTSISSPVCAAACNLTHEIEPFDLVRKCDVGYSSKSTLFISVKVGKMKYFVLYKAIRIHPVCNSTLAVFSR